MICGYLNAVGSHSGRRLKRAAQLRRRSQQRPDDDGDELVLLADESDREPPIAAKLASAPSWKAIKSESPFSRRHIQQLYSSSRRCKYFFALGRVGAAASGSSSSGGCSSRDPRSSESNRPDSLPALYLHVSGWSAREGGFRGRETPFFPSLDDSATTL